MANISASATPFNAYDMTGGSSSLEINADLDDKKFVGIQVFTTGATGVLNGTVTLEQSNNGTNWTNEGLPQQVDIDDPNVESFMQVNDFTAAKLRVVFVAGGITGGTLDVIVNAK